VVWHSEKVNDQMRFFDREATTIFLAECNRGPSVEGLDKEFLDEHFYQAEFVVPVEYGKLLSLLRHIFRVERNSAWTLIVAQSPGIWPSWEDKNLYRMMRDARNISAEMSYGDSFLFDPSETDDMVTFANTFACFRYDFRILDADREIHAFFSHDDWVFIQLAEKFGQAFTQILDFTTESPYQDKRQLLNSE
jgi:hypothetical protein